MSKSPRVIAYERSGGTWPPVPRPREELRGMSPLAKVLAQLEALWLVCKPSYDGYAAECPVHRGESLNFEIVELSKAKVTRKGNVLPAGTVLVHCQAYGGYDAEDSCSQENVIEALGLWSCDLFPEEDTPLDGGSRAACQRSPGRESDRKQPLSEAEYEHLNRLVDEFEANAVSAAHGGRLSQLVNQLGCGRKKLGKAMLAALARFRVGWRSPDFRQVDGTIETGECWTIPERDGLGRITGFNRRYEDGSKRFMAGGRRGLYIPDGWAEMPGPIWCPEGFSDAAVLVAQGACAIGRPNVGGGVDHLAELLGDDTRPIVILGENDERPLMRDGKPVLKDGRPALRRPGYDGAVAACKRLRRDLGRADIKVKMPPEGFKDIREYITRERNTR
jgi:hypothetical protein